MTLAYPAVMRGHQYESGVADSYPHVMVYLSIISICVSSSYLDISQQYLFLDSDHSSTLGSRGDQADGADPNIIAKEALLTQHTAISYPGYTGQPG